MSFSSATIDLYTNKYPTTKGSTASHGTLETKATHIGGSAASAYLSSSSLGDYSRSTDLYSTSFSASTSSAYGNDVTYYTPLSRPASSLHHSPYSASSVFQSSSYHSTYSGSTPTYSLKHTSVSSIPKRPSTRSYTRYSRKQARSQSTALPTTNQFSLSRPTARRGESPPPSSCLKPSADVLEEESKQESELAEDVNEETSTEEEATATTDADDVNESDSDSDNGEEEDDDTELGVKFVSRSTSPLRAHDTDTNCNKKKQELYGNSDNQKRESTDSCIAATEQSVRPKKYIFGSNAKKCQATQVNEVDLLPNWSRSSDLSSKYLNSTTWTGSSSFATSSTRRTFANGSYTRAASRSTTNRYSAPVLSTAFNCRDTYPSPRSTVLSAPSKSPSPRPTSAVDAPSNTPKSDTHAKADCISPVTGASACPPPLYVSEDSAKLCLAKSCDESSDITSDTCDSSSTSAYSDTRSAARAASEDSSSNRMHINSPSSRLSPRIIRRSINYKSTSPRSSEQPLSAASSETEDDSSECSKRGNQSNSPSSRIALHLDCPKLVVVSSTSGNQSPPFVQKQHTGSYENLCKASGQLMSHVQPERSSSAEPFTTLFRGGNKDSPAEASNEDHKSWNSSTGSNCSLSPSEHIVLRTPPYRRNEAATHAETPLIVVNKLPIKIKDPYSTESESEFGAESEDEEVSNTVTIRLSSANSNYSNYSGTVINGDSLKEDFSEDESHDDKMEEDQCESASQTGTSTEQESEDEINKAITRIESNASSLKASSTGLIRPRTSGKGVTAPAVINIAANEIEGSKVKDCLRDSGYSENLARPDSPYDNVKPIELSSATTTSSSSASSDTESNNEASKSDDKKDVNVSVEESLASAIDKKSLVERCQQELSAFISKCKDIDEMIGPTSPRSPLSPTFLQVFQSFNSGKHRLSALSEEPESDDSVSVFDASHVKVHHSPRMQSTVGDIFTELPLQTATLALRRQFPIAPIAYHRWFSCAATYSLHLLCSN